MNNGRKPLVGNALQELNRRRLIDLQSRQLATNILAPEALARQKHSPAKLLSTTLGGNGARQITDRDLQAFRRAVAAVGKQLREGVTAREVIDFSTQADRDRARRQIHYAVPARMRDGSVIFSVSAGPESKVSRHMVVVQFHQYGSALSMPGTALQAATWLCRESPLKLDCDCAHWRYGGFRYIATIGGFNAGRAESGFPKLKNPELRGLACKHVLRAASELEASGFVRKQVATMLQADRDRLARPQRVKPRVILVTQQQADIAPRRPHAIRTSDDQQRRALAAGLRKVLGRGSTPGAQRTDVRATLAALQARKDVSAQAILAALQQVLRSSPGATP
jgi:hypothetical protein